MINLFCAPNSSKLTPSINDSSIILDKIPMVGKTKHDHSQQGDYNDD